MAKFYKARVIALQSMDLNPPKIALSSIGFDSGVLKDQTHPLWSLPHGADPYINVCKADHNPRTWLRDSCLWYSRILTNKLGMEKFQDYMTKFSYDD